MKHWIRIVRDRTGAYLNLASGFSGNRFYLVTRGRLLLLAAGMAGLWTLAAPAVMSSGEQLLWERVRAAQLHLSEWSQQNGSSVSDSTDPWNCGLIGVEWSAVTTTLGDLSSKRTACNPAWAVQFSRWFHESGLKTGDPVAIYSSASFPGLLLNAIAAAEEMDLKLLLVVSLGASTWGANHPDYPWPVLATELRRAGFIRKRADYYTLGGGFELGQGLSPEGKTLLREAAKEAGVELLMTESLEEMIIRKTELLARHQSRLLVSIGGSHANLGENPEILRLRTGMVPTTDIGLAGNGIIGAAMRNQLPVIHMLNIRSLSERNGIPFDSPPRKAGPAKMSNWWSGAGLILFFTVLMTHRRWKLEPGFIHKLLVTCSIFLTACAPVAEAPDRNPADHPPLNLVLEGGSVWKGSGSNPVVTDIGIRGDRIVAMGDLSGREAKQRIAVDGLDVVPGFIDIHSHAVRGSREKSGIFKHPDAENYIRQGVTTVIGGPDGGSELSIENLLNDFERNPASVNFGTFIGHNTVREAVMGREDRAPGISELEAMKALVRTAMLDGAYGLSSGLKYIPGAYSETEEVIELARVAARYDGIYISHMREEGLDLIKSVKETIRIGEEAGLPAQITHHKVMGVEMWGASVETLALVDAANARGVDVSSDQYPYAASSTGISVLFPAWSLAGPREEQMARLKDPETRARIKKGIVFNLIHDRGGDDPSRVAIANCEWDISLNGKDFAEILRERGQAVNMDTAADLALEIQENGGCSGVFHAMSEEDVARIMQHPRTMIASDGGIHVAGEGVPHPRNYGSFSRVLAWYVRDKQVISTGEAIYKMSKFPAQRIGLTNRGRIEVGAMADIAVMDLDEVQDHASFDRPHQFSTGVQHVLVNGVIVLRDSEMTGKRPGRSLRSR